MSYDGDWTEPAVPLTALTPYLGRFVRFRVQEPDAVVSVCGFLTEIHSGRFILDYTDQIVPQKYALAAYNIVNKLIAGDPEA
jgi:hypothetical protein